MCGNRELAPNRSSNFHSVKTYKDQTVQAHPIRPVIIIMGAPPTPVRRTRPTTFFGASLVCWIRRGRTTFIALIALLALIYLSISALLTPSESPQSWILKESSARTFNSSASVHLKPSSWHTYKPDPWDSSAYLSGDKATNHFRGMNIDDLCSLFL